MRSAAIFWAFVFCSTMAAVSSLFLPVPVLDTEHDLADTAIHGLTATATIISNGLTIAAIGAAIGEMGMYALPLPVLALIKAKLLYLSQNSDVLGRSKRSTSVLEVVQKEYILECIFKTLCLLQTVPVEQLSPAALTFKAELSGNYRQKSRTYTVVRSKQPKINPRACELFIKTCPLSKRELFYNMERAFTH